MSICAIHQPNFFPWLGYFDKIRRADIFVFLDDVQNPKTGSSWVNRTKLDSLGQEKWYTCPIVRMPGVMPINQVLIHDLKWREGFLNILKSYYRKHPNLEKGLGFVGELIYRKDYYYLADMNKDIIMYCTNYLGYETKFVAKSELNIKSKSTQMLIDVCKAVGANTYLCGGGAAGYQEDELFKTHDINLVYQNFIPEPYKEKGFLPGLSVIDYIMSVI